MRTKMERDEEREAERSAARESERIIDDRCKANLKYWKDKGVASEREFRGPALLNCSATPSCGRWVLHRFSHIEHATTREGDELQHVDIEFYECETCGALRRWGWIMPATATAKAVEQLSLLTEPAHA